MKRIVLTESIAAPIDEVWAAITDHESMADWSPLRRVELAREGSPQRNGLGAVRHMVAVGPVIVEEVTEWSPPNRYKYRLRAGAPIRDHLGTVELRQSGARTNVTWTIQFRPIVPGSGWVILRILRMVIGGMLARLRTQLEAR